MPKYGEQIFSHMSFPEVGEKQKAEKKKKEKEKSRWMAHASRLDQFEKLNISLYLLLYKNADMFKDWILLEFY